MELIMIFFIPFHGTGRFLIDHMHRMEQEASWPGKSYNSSTLHICRPINIRFHWRLDRLRLGISLVPFTTLTCSKVCGGFSLFGADNVER
jgi:hypothetical protein